MLYITIFWTALKLLIYSISHKSFTRFLTENHISIVGARLLRPERKIASNRAGRPRPYKRFMRYVQVIFYTFRPAGAYRL